MRLHDLQSRFADILLTPPSEAAHSIAPLSDALAENGLPLTERLRVYQDNVQGGLSALLRDMYPACVAMIGEDCFLSVARAFVRANPPRSGCMNHYGEDLAPTLQSHPATRALLWLPDLARLEAAINAAHYAPDDRPLTAAALAKIAAPETAAIPLRAAIHLINSRWPLQALRNVALAPDEHTPPDLSAPAPCALIVSRPHLRVEIEVLSPARYAFYDRLRSGATLEAATAAAIEQEPAFDLTATLDHALKNEIFRHPDTTDGVRCF